jgi:hypothetical protein
VTATATKTLNMEIDVGFSANRRDEADNHDTTARSSKSVMHVAGGCRRR